MDNNTNNINNSVPDENEQLLMRKKQATEAAMREREAELERRRQMAARREAQLKAEALRQQQRPQGAAPQQRGESVPVRGARPAIPPKQRPQPPAARPAVRQPQTTPQRAPATQSPASSAETTAAHTAATVTKESKEKKANLSKAGAEMMSSAIKALIYIVLVVVVSIFLSILIIRVGNDMFALVKSDEVIDITLPEDATLDDVAEILHENSIISFPGIFKFYANLKKDSGEFLAGDYSVSPSMSYDELRAMFKPKIATGTSWITFPEGSTCDEIISILVSYGIGTREGYIDVINNYDFSYYWFVNEIPENDYRFYRLEGYLFPDTYEFYNNSSEAAVINKMLSRFEEVFVDDYQTKAKELGYTIDEIITLASMVEKESGSSADFRNVSSVFHNRLNKKATYPKLESDATTIYAMQVLAGGVRPDEVTPDDIRPDEVQAYYEILNSTADKYSVSFTDAQTAELSKKIKTVVDATLKAPDATTLAKTKEKINDALEAANYPAGANGDAHREAVSRIGLYVKYLMYTTYRVDGLTPGAIANPSISAIRYALYPAETSYYFFVADKSGNTLFASSQKEHEQNIAKIKADEE